MEALGECDLYGQPVTAPIFEMMLGLRGAKRALPHRRANCIKKSEISRSAGPSLRRAAWPHSGCPCCLALPHAVRGVGCSPPWDTALYKLTLVYRSFFSFLFFFLKTEDFKMSHIHGLE